MTTSTIFVPAAEKPARRSGQIRLHGPEDFEGMRKAGRLTAEALDLVGPLVKPGATTNALDRFVFEFARDHGAYPAPLNYRGYRKSICTSINHVVCHGQPDDKPLREGDILNIDVTFIVDGWHGDASRMFAAGEPPRRAQRLMEVTYEALMRGDGERICVLDQHRLDRGPMLQRLRLAGENGADERQFAPTLKFTGGVRYSNDFKTGYEAFRLILFNFNATNFGVGNFGANTPAIDLTGTACNGTIYPGAGPCTINTATGQGVRSLEGRWDAITGSANLAWTPDYLNEPNANQ